LGFSLFSATASIAQAQIHGIKTDANTGYTGLFTITPPAAPVGTFHAPTAINIVDLNTQAKLTWVDALAVNSKGDLFAYDNSTHYSGRASSTTQLIRINKSTGEAQPIGSAWGPPAYIAGAAFDANDNLWIVNTANYTLRQINPADGSTIGASISITGFTAHALESSEAVDIVFDSDNKAYLSVDYSIYSLNVATGAASLLYTFPLPSPLVTPPNANPLLGGMAFDNNGGFWLSQHRNLDRIVYSADISSTALAAAHNAVMDLSGDTGVLNSGPTDLASWPFVLPTSVPANNPVALIGLAFGVIGAGGMMLRRRRKQAR
jgi:hypothetical protein